MNKAPETLEELKAHGIAHFSELINSCPNYDTLVALLYVLDQAKIIFIHELRRSLAQESQQEPKILFAVEPTEDIL